MEQITTIAQIMNSISWREKAGDCPAHGPFKAFALDDMAPGCPACNEQAREQEKKLEREQNMQRAKERPWLKLE